MTLKEPIFKNLERWATEAQNIPAERKDLLKKIADYVLSKSEKRPAQLVFICTHNSRRSHLSQVWASIAASYYGVESLIQCYSGGTEATAFNVNAIKALEQAGFTIDIPQGINPKVKLGFSEDAEPLECYSKTYDHPANPDSEFAAIMTCSEADQNCPFIPGAELRIPLRYDDPKIADGTSEQQQVYWERSKQIATEMLYMASLLT